MINDDLWAEFKDEQDEDKPKAASPKPSLSPAITPSLTASSPKKESIGNYFSFLFNRLTAKNNTQTQKCVPSVKNTPKPLSTPYKPEVDDGLPIPLPNIKSAMPDSFEVDDLWAEDEVDQSVIEDASSTNLDTVSNFLTPDEEAEIFNSDLEAFSIYSSPSQTVTLYSKSESTTSFNSETGIGNAQFDIDLWGEEEPASTQAELNLTEEAEPLEPAESYFTPEVNHNTLSSEDLADFALEVTVYDFSADLLHLEIDLTTQDGSSGDDLDFATAVDVSEFEASNNLLEDFSFDALELSIEEELEKIRQEAATRYQHELRSVVRAVGKPEKTKTLNGVLAKAAKDYYNKDAFYQYLCAIQHIKLLTPEQERELAIRIAAGDKEAKEQFISANLRLVIHIARRYSKACQSLTLEDLVQEGNLGLIKAAEKFHYERGFKFSTYATWWIRQAISRAIADKDRAIRLPVHINETLGRLRKILLDFDVKYKREPTAEEIAQIIGLDVVKVRQLLQIEQPLISLNQPLDNDDDPLTRPGYMARTEAALALGAEVVSVELIMNKADEEGTIGTIRLLELAHDARYDDLDENVYRISLCNAVNKILNTLPERERRIIELRFGLNLAEGHQHTLEEIGQIMRLTRERIRQIEAKAFRRLQHPKTGLLLKVEGFLEPRLIPRSQPPDLTVKPKDKYMVKASEVARQNLVTPLVSPSISLITHRQEIIEETQSFVAQNAAVEPDLAQTKRELPVVEKVNPVQSSFENKPPQIQVKLEPELAKLVSNGPSLNVSESSNPEDILKAWKQFQDAATPLRDRNLTLWNDELTTTVIQTNSRIKHQSKEAELFKKWKRR